MKKYLLSLNIRLDSLTIFRSLLDDPVIVKLQKFLNSLSHLSEDDEVTTYCDFVSELYKNTPVFDEYILSLLLNNENFYIKERALSHEVPEVVERCLAQELVLLQELSQLSSKDVKNIIPYDEFLPDWETSGCDISTKYKECLSALPTMGYGVLSKYRAFSIDDGQLVPIKFPDTQTLEQLFGYQREQDLIIKNTEALISGAGANNILLYGDAGTGKSSTIKAIANHYADKGLRLVEVKKNQLYQIPQVLDELTASPLKFILFIDDLSFVSNDDNFSALKAILEGSVATGGKNIAIYATSNRRHLVKESMSDRNGDELHANDTMQETMSLAARFGLTITYQQPSKEEYISIVKCLADEYDLEMPEDELIKKAEAHAIRNNGRSPRVAKQFVELQKIGI